MAPPISPNDKKWEIEDAARILMRAEEVKANKTLFKAAKKELNRQAKAIHKVTKKLPNVVGIA